MKTLATYFLSLVIALLLYQNGYSQEPVLDFDFVETSSSRQRTLRVGIAFKRDNYVYEHYYWKANLVIGTFQRKAQWSLGLQWQLLTKNKLLWLTLDGDYQEDQVEFDENDLAEILSNFPGPDFKEKISYHRYGISPGIQIEPMMQCGVSPYLNAKCLLVFPSRFRYSYEVPSGGSVFTPLIESVENGAKMSIGWEIEAGLRVQTSSSTMLCLGLYYQELEQKIDWPVINSREFGDTILGFNHLGFIARFSYVW